MKENKILAINIMRELIRELITIVNLTMPRGIDDIDQRRRMRALYSQLESLNITEYDDNGDGTDTRRESIFPPTDFQSHSKTIFRRRRPVLYLLPRFQEKI